MKNKKNIIIVKKTTVKKKIERTKQQYKDNPELRAEQNNRCKMRYWEKKAKFLEFEKMLLEKGCF